MFQSSFLFSFPLIFCRNRGASAVFAFYRKIGQNYHEVTVLLFSFVRGVILYILLVAVIRMMGKRQVGQMEPSEFVVTMMVADFAAIPLEKADIPLYTGVIPILTVLGMELVLSGLSMGSIRFRKFVCGKPVILIENGHILQNNLRRTRVTMDELTGHLREKDVLDLESVQYAILETNGNLSVFPYTKDAPASAQDAGLSVKEQYLPITIISDGRVEKENLKISGKDEKWLQKELKKQKATVKETWLLTVDKAGKVFFCRKEEK